MEEKNKELEISVQDLLDVLKRCWIVMLAVLLFVGAGLYAFLKVTHEDEYTATSSIFVFRDTGNDTSTADLNLAIYLIKDCEEICVSDAVLERVVAEAAPDMEIKKLRKAIDVANGENTRILDISVTAKTPEQAKLLADSITKNTREFFNDQLFGGQTMVKSLDPTGGAPLPERPSNPISKIKVMLIAVVAALVVYAAYFVLYLLDDKINTAEDVEKYLGLSLLGDIPNRDSALKKKSKNGYYYYYASDSDTEKKEGGEAHENH